MDVLKTSRKDVHMVTSLGRPQDLNFEPLIIFSLFSPNVCLNTEELCRFIVLRFAETSQRHPISVPKSRLEGEVLETFPEQYTFLW